MEAINILKAEVITMATPAILEEWRDIKGYEGLYQISNLGRVKSIERTNFDKSGSRYNIHEKILKIEINRNGYKYVGLWKDNIGHQKEIHRVMAVAFIPNPENKPMVDHHDKNPLNNNLNNLRWCTRAENRYNQITNSSTGIKNVSLDKRHDVYRVQFHIGGTYQHFGSYKTLEEATVVANAKRHELHGEFYCE